MGDNRLISRSMACNSQKFQNKSESSSSSDTSAGQRFQPHNRTLEVGSLVLVVESTTVTRIPGTSGSAD